MKKFSIMALLAAVAFSSFCQPFRHKPKGQDQTEYWEKKSRNLKIASLSMVGAGTFLLVAGSRTSPGADGTGEGILKGGGILLMIGAIPLGIWSHFYRNKFKKAQLTFSVMPEPTLQAMGKLKQKIQPGLTLTMPIGR